MKGYLIVRQIIILNSVHQADRMYQLLWEAREGSDIYN